MDSVKDAKLRMTFKTAAEQYIESKENVLSPSTIREYNGTIRKLSHAFLDMNLNDITAVDVQKEINHQAKIKSPKTVCNYHGLISSVLKTFRPNLVINTTLPHKIEKELYIPTGEDVKRIMAAAAGTNYEVALMLACFGLRRSEICALTLYDINGNIIPLIKPRSLIRITGLLRILLSQRTVPEIYGCPMS